VQACDLTIAFAHREPRLRRQLRPRRERAARLQHGRARVLQPAPPGTHAPLLPHRRLRGPAASPSQRAPPAACERASLVSPVLSVALYRNHLCAPTRAQLDAALVAADARWHLQRSYQLRLGGGRAELFFFDTSPFVQKYYETRWAARVGARPAHAVATAAAARWSLAGSERAAACR